MLNWTNLVAQNIDSTYRRKLNKRVKLISILLGFTALFILIERQHKEKRVRFPRRESVFNVDTFTSSEALKSVTNNSI